MFSDYGVSEAMFGTVTIEQRAMGILLQYSSLPSLARESPRIGAFNTKLDDHDGALTR